MSIFRQVRHALRDDGTLWLNIGDGYARNGGSGNCGPNARVGNTKKNDSEAQLQSTGLLGLERPGFDGVAMACSVRFASRWMVFALKNYLGEKGADAGERDKSALPPPPKKYSCFPIRQSIFTITRRCILLGSRSGDLVLDPFSGSGTTGVVAAELNRRAVLIELNKQYAEDSKTRIDKGIQRTILTSG